MENKESLYKTDSLQTLAHDDEYFKYVFKKTEKICGAVLYILKLEKDSPMTHTTVLDAEEAARVLLQASLRVLQSSYSNRFHDLEDLRYKLVALESRLRVLAAIQYISEEILSVFVNEVESVDRTIRRYTKIQPFTQILVSPIPERVNTVRTRDSVREERKSPVIQGKSALPLQGRRERILEVIKEIGEATIKDISERVTDCSEKTIQRELIELIKDSVIVREGERRWSKYKFL